MYLFSEQHCMYLTLWLLKQAGLPECLTARGGWAQVVCSELIWSKCLCLDGHNEFTWVSPFTVSPEVWHPNCPAPSTCITNTPDQVTSVTLDVFLLDMKQSRVCLHHLAARSSKHTTGCQATNTCAELSGVKLFTTWRAYRAAASTRLTSSWIERAQANIMTLKHPPTALFIHVRCGCVVVW